MSKPLTEQEETRRGELIVEMLHLVPTKPIRGESWTDVRYLTKHGTKTALGLFRSIKRIVEEGE